MTESDPAGVLALTAQSEQIFGQAERQSQIAADVVIDRLPPGNLKELRRSAELLPQLSCAGIRLARLRRPEAFNSLQHRAQGTANFELLPLSYRCVRQQSQLVQPLVKLRGRFRHRRAGGG